MPLLLGSAILIVVSGVSAPQTRDCSLATALNEDAFRSLAEAGVAARRLKQLIDQCGLAIRVPEGSTLDQQLQKLGAPPALLRELAPPDNPAPRALWVAPVDRREMVFIPGGSFGMGSPPGEEGRDPDETLHTVTVGDLWIDRREVSTEAFRTFVGVNPEYQKGWTDASGASASGDYPVTGVTWFAARAYCRWAGKRLPTEAEWEYTARSGTTGPYWWGASFDRGRVAPVLATPLQETPWRVIAMVGGVWEWTSSAMKPYPYNAGDGREDPSGAPARVMRGGFWNSGERFLRVANRSSAPPETVSDEVGFRCAR